jgi:hypothetical protein
MVVLKIKTSELTFSNGTNMETIPIPGAEIYYEKNFLSPEAATILFNVLRTKYAWERRRASFNYAVPRDEAYYGDPGTNYRLCLATFQSAQKKVHGRRELPA